MAVNDKSAGPKVGMCVWYNNNGVNQMADITAVNPTNGTVSLNVWPAGGALLQLTGVIFSPSAQNVGTWGWADFL
jgi:hypothetical protein